jgi:hypothetical protein
MEKNRIELFNGKAFGVEVSEYGLDHGYLDYYSLAQMMGDCILNNTIREATPGEWEIVNGAFDKAVISDHIISKRGYEILKDYTNELVFYNDRLNVYIWAIDHWGTDWNYVLTDVKLV